jgi:uncharacterized membrane protein YeiH
MFFVITHSIFFLLLDHVGALAFAVSGATAAHARRLDLFGILIVAFVVACGGGIVRDLLLGTLPPENLSNWRYLLITAAACFFAIYGGALLKTLKHPVLFFDALGLGLFSVTGAYRALTLGHGGELAIISGVVTAVGGGVIRDVFLARVPVIFQAEIYGIAALLGASALVCLIGLGVGFNIAAPVGILSCVCLRLLSIKFGWSLPRFSRKEDV